MTLLPKQWQNSNLRETKQIICHSKEEPPINVLLLNLGYCVKSYGHFCQFLVLFTMSTYQIWPCHVIYNANFDVFLFCLCSILGKVTKFLVVKLSTSDVISQKPHEEKGVENTPPVPLGLNFTRFLPIVYSYQVSASSDLNQKKILRKCTFLSCF